MVVVADGSSSHRARSDDDRSGLLIEHEIPETISPERQEPVRVEAAQDAPKS
jgi:hypothetical protein